MNKKSFIILLGVSVAMAVFAWLTLIYQNKQAGSLSAGDTVLPGLAADLAAVNRIELLPANSSAYDLVETDGGWQVQQRQYPANFSKVRQLIDQLSKAKYYEAKTRDPANYTALGVGQPDDPKNTGVWIKIYVKDKPQPYELIVGKLAATWDGSYARLPTEAQSWLLDRQIPVDNALTAWLSQDIINFPYKRVQRIEFRAPQGEVLQVSKASPETAHFTVDNFPKGKTLRYDTVADGLSRSFEAIRLQDVVSEQDFKFNSSKAFVVNATMFDGLTVSITIEKREGRYYLKTQFGFDEAVANKKWVPDEVIASARDELKTLTARTQGWVYLVGQHIYEDLSKTMADMLPEKNTPEQPAL